MVSTANAASYTDRVLGLGPGCAYSEGVSINDGETVLCTSMTSGGGPAASMWIEESGWTDLYEQNVISGAGINNKGQTVVEHRVESSGWHWYRPFVRNADGTLIELLAPPGVADVWPCAINESGQVAVGLEYRDQAGDTVQHQAAIVDAATDAILVPMPSPDSGISAINNNGYVVMESYTNSPYMSSAYIWSAASGLSLLSRLDGSVFAAPWDVNDSGIVVGTSDSHAVKWDSDGHVFDLGLGFAGGINNVGQIVGALGDSATMWDSDGSVVDLGLPEGASSAWANAINNNGQIVGGATIDGCTVAVLWQPVPEPSSLLALLCGLGSTCVLTRRSLRRPS